MENVLVTGGCGFIGSHIVDAFVGRGKVVTVFDKDIRELNSKAVYFEGDILDVDTVEKALVNQDLVVHAAGLSDLNAALNMPLESLALNVESTVNLITVGLKVGVKRFGFCSSVYADSEFGGFYGCSKKSAEIYIKEFITRFGLDARIMRLGSVYGPRSDDKNGIHRIVKGAIVEGRIGYTGDLEALREYIHVFDVAESVADICCMSKGLTTYLISGMEKTKVEDCIRLIGHTLKIPESDVLLSQEQYLGHYHVTPYTVPIDVVKKFVREEFIPLDVGIYEICKSLSEQISENLE